jgi:hypothetical protein
MDKYEQQETYYRDRSRETGMNMQATRAYEEWKSQQSPEGYTMNYMTEDQRRKHWESIYGDQYVDKKSPTQMAGQMGLRPASRLGMEAPSEKTFPQQGVTQVFVTNWPGTLVDKMMDQKSKETETGGAPGEVETKESPLMDILKSLSASVGSLNDSLVKSQQTTDLSEFVDKLVAGLSEVKDATNTSNQSIAAELNGIAESLKAAIEEKKTQENLINPQPAPQAQEQQVPEAAQVAGTATAGEQKTVDMGIVLQKLDTLLDSMSQKQQDSGSDAIVKAINSLQQSGMPVTIADLDTLLQSKQKGEPGAALDKRLTKLEDEVKSNISTGISKLTNQITELKKKDLSESVFNNSEQIKSISTILVKLRQSIDEASSTAKQALDTAGKALSRQASIQKPGVNDPKKA